MEKQSFNRKELYEMVWKEPMLTLSKKFNISDVGLRKICIKMNIPLPENGHWQKIKYGKKIKQSPLPKDYSGEGEKIFGLRTKADQLFVGPSPVNVLKHEIENNLEAKLIVPEFLTKPHELILSLKKDLQSKQQDTYQYIGTVSSSRNELNVRVSTKNISRALRFMDTLIKALYARGHTIEFKNGETCVIIGEHEYEIQLREKMKKVVIEDMPWNRTVYHPTGIFAFQIARYLHREWKDGKILIELQISKIIAALEISAKEWTDLRIKQRAEEDIRKEKERIKLEFEMQREKDLENFKEMMIKANRWHTSNNLRNYISEMEARSLNKENLPAELFNWFQWARDKADWYDPFIEKEDLILKEVDRNSLTIKKK